MPVLLRCVVGALVVTVGGWSMAVAADEPVPNQPPEGFRALFNGKDLDGWRGMATENPYKLAAKTAEEREAFFAKNQPEFEAHWKVVDGVLVNDGHGPYATTVDDFGDIELLVEYKTVPKADSGVYLRATPQVQIWDCTNEAAFKHGAQKGSCGLWNNGEGSPGKDPLHCCDKPFGQWNRIRIVQVGARTSVWFNDNLVVDNCIMENYWDRKKPLLRRGPMQLQTHGGEISWRNIFVREIGADEANTWLAERSGDGFESIFNGTDFAGWKGPLDNYEIVDGAIRCKKGKGGTIHTEREFADYVVKLEFKLPEGGNNGLAIRYPGEGDTAYVGMCELQVLDSGHPKYAKLDPRQLHGSAYGVVAAEQGYLRPTGEWNFEVVTVKGGRITVELNGSVILDADVASVKEFMDNAEHPGLTRTSGSFGFAGHSDPVEFRKIAIKKID